MATTSTQTKEEWDFTIPIHIANESDEEIGVSDVPNLPQTLKDDFARDGFIALRRPVLLAKVCDELNRRLEEILRGRYSTGVAPTKAPRTFRNNEYRGSAHIRPKLDLSHLTVAERKAYRRPPPQAIVGPLGFNGNLENVKVLQVINAHKADELFRNVVYAFGPIVAQLTGWKSGVRLASDQIWAKPPYSHALAFHRDSPYFMFDPPDVVTVWIALDDMDEELGPLHYVSGSHLWGDEQWGAMDGFFDESMESLARAAKDRDFEIVSMNGMAKGGVSIHDGRTWHGSPRNMSKSRPRRGFGVHYVPAQVRFTEDAAMSQLWRPFVKDFIDSGGDIKSMEVSREHFPVVWAPTVE